MGPASSLLLSAFLSSKEPSSRFLLPPCKGSNGFDTQWVGRQQYYLESHRSDLYFYLDCNSWSTSLLTELRCSYLKNRSGNRCCLRYRNVAIITIDAWLVVQNTWETCWSRKVRVRSGSRRVAFFLSGAPQFQAHPHGFPEVNSSMSLPVMAALVCSLQDLFLNSWFTMKMPPFRSGDAVKQKAAHGVELQDPRAKKPLTLNNHQLSTLVSLVLRAEFLVSGFSVFYLSLESWWQA